MKWGCLLIHGFGGASFEMQPLAEAVKRAGGTAKCITLPGHDSSVTRFRETFFNDWASYAEEQFVTFSREVDHAAVAGLSMGGTLSLYIAARHSPAAVVSIAAPIHVYRIIPWEMKDWRLPLVRFLRFVRPVWPSAPRSSASQEIAPWRGYDGVNLLPQLWSLIEGCRSVGRILGNVTCPAMVLHAPTDRTSPPSNAWRIITSISSAVRQMHLLPVTEKITAHHLLTTHRETSGKVGQLVTGFIKDNITKL
ncbi:putative carboxylesterase [Oleidesulfovibrio alaskensis G20]|uniref:Putative carboxylesterase n=1 Tax=Oleidesulfovibrio alaskensis (strain ATCC BAA-1058 / DSM 17464 / G20) TaxID=207559 RepID=Q310N6_OLEA2|nr:alpha/beta fold hydrolase [Oleidesulfovibrio alaskensis]ABB38610.1 putative carboxylesterase [Oleidesulfovibrio alaskensis G20]MBG0773907.1 alpha/beta fold hydrolase [Oleidesulfovibrio alaskensis]